MCAVFFISQNHVNRRFLHNRNQKLAWSEIGFSKCQFAAVQNFNIQTSRYRPHLCIGYRFGVKLSSKFFFHCRLVYVQLLSSPRTINLNMTCIGEYCHEIQNFIAKSIIKIDKFIIADLIFNCFQPQLSLCSLLMSIIYILCQEFACWCSCTLKDINRTLCLRLVCFLPSIQKYHFLFCFIRFLPCSQFCVFFLFFCK